MKSVFPVKHLLDWFRQNQRPFPWREERSPYRIWISEVMLQQTRASVVIPYFLRWMEKFPDVKTLAKASLEEVIKAWEGLGYYSRARNLHRGAKQMLEQFNGEVPHTREELSEIYGLGPYTIGAILSFGFQQRAAAVDGNATRVIARYFAIVENVGRSHVRKIIEEKAIDLLDAKKPWITAEALIELGATLCLQRPRCEACPLQGSCLGFKRGIAEALPTKNKEITPISLIRTVAVIEAEGMFLIRKGEKGKVMADLYEFPYFEETLGSIQTLEKRVKKRFGLTVKVIQRLDKVVHTFTRYKVSLFPVLLQGKNTAAISDWEWVRRLDLQQLPFSSGHRRIVQQLL